MTFQHFLNARRYSPNAAPPPQSHSRTRQQRHFYQSLPATRHAMANPLRIHTGQDYNAVSQQHDQFGQRRRSSAAPNGLPLPAHHNSHQYAPRYQPSFSFDEAIAFPDDQSMFDTSASSWTTAPAPIFPFRPVDGYHTEQVEHLTPSVSPDTVQPTKIETSPCMPALSLLDEDVDASNYEPVSNDDWALASTDYGPSPASTHGPFTPLETDASEGSFNQHNSKAWAGAPRSIDHNRALAQYGGDVMFQPQIREDASMLTSVYGSAPSSTWSIGPSAPNSSFGTNTSVNPTNDSMTLYTNPTYPTHPHSHAQANPIFHHPNPVLPSTTLYAPSETSHSASSEEPTQQNPPNNPQHSEAATTATTNGETEHRRNRDAYLLEMRRKGHSYKTIKRRGGFREAESTLRGRVRVLTKEKWERVRRPEWTEADLRLLRLAVRSFQHNAGARGRAAGAEDAGFETAAPGKERKIPWKKVSERIKEMGGTYLFAPATCAKKWQEGGF
ncbi:hypothetical protein MBLNU230_g2453t1 [Neophaeotheca triangularis]